MWTVRPSQVVLAALLLLGAGSMGSGPLVASAASGPQDALHQVMPGDDLHLIAGYYYGDARQWERIWDANRDQLRNPDRIQRGTLLHIPDATVPSEPYADFVARARLGAARPGAAGKAEAPAAPEVEIRVMGEGPPAAGRAEGAAASPGVPGSRGGPAGPTAPQATPPAPRP